MGYAKSKDVVVIEEYVILGYVKVYMYYQVHHEEPERNGISKPGAVVWYHCPLPSCVYHADFGASGRHFTKHKYLKQVWCNFLHKLKGYILLQIYFLDKKVNNDKLMQKWQ